ncbi:MAG: T9SS type A sorting domain-containing protein [Bacteroidales bacterium]
MQRYFFIPIAFLTVLNLNAQVFAPEEAVWYYNYDPDITLDDGYRKVDVLGDTTIGLHNCQILRTIDIGYNYIDNDYYEIAGDSIFIYEKDSIVYYFKSSEFYILYDFTARTGDTIHTISYPDNCDSTYKIIIDSISYQYVSQDSLREYYFHINDDAESFYYLEKIGYPDYLLPAFPNGCDILTGPHYPGPLRCYMDNIIGNYSSGVSPTCDYITGINGVDPERQINIFPNPTQGLVEIYSEDNQVYTYEIIDQLGRLMENKSFQSYNRIDLSDYMNGLYFVILKSNHIVVCTYKIIKY